MVWKALQLLYCVFWHIVKANIQWPSDTSTIHDTAKCQITFNANMAFYVYVNTFKTFTVCNNCICHPRTWLWEIKYS